MEHRLSLKSFPPKAGHEPCSLEGQCLTYLATGAPLKEKALILVSKGNERTGLYMHSQIDTIDSNQINKVISKLKEVKCEFKSPPKMCQESCQ